MTIKITFLGTGAAQPSDTRRTTATVLQFDDMRILVDAGESVFQSIIQSGQGFRNLNHLLVSHAHLDHILGVFSLITNTVRNEMGGISRLHMIAERQAYNRIMAMVKAGNITEGAKDANLFTAAPINKDGEVVINKKNLTVTAFPVQHRAPAMGFVFKTSDRAVFDEAKALELHIPKDARRAELMQGKTVLNAMGEEVTSKQVISGMRSGKKIVYIPDCCTGTLNTFSDLVHDADVLIAEGTYLLADEAKARQHQHLMVAELAQFAIRNRVGRLFINHISSRYQPHLIRAEAAIFAGAVVVEDGQTVNIQ